MPWKSNHLAEERLRFVRAALAKEDSVAELCRQFQISRVTGYLWIRRIGTGGEQAATNRSHRPHQPRGKRPLGARWMEAAIELRKRHPTWGTSKILAALRRKHPKACLPARASLSRRFQQLELIRRRTSRRRTGPLVPSPETLTKATACNEVWTLDFKGTFKVGNGQTCRLLTLRDLHSRYVLLVKHLARPDDAMVRKAMERVFCSHGLPKAILVDNGSPFAGCGALGLSRLSVWWTRLGIAVFFTRRGKPQDNGAHEQMHRVLKAETANPPAADLRLQQRRCEQWREYYNLERPHAGIANRMPGEVYQKSDRKLHTPEPLNYSSEHLAYRVPLGGRIYWQKKQVMIGRAFAGENIGIKASGEDASVMQVYFGTQCIGELHADLPSDMLPARYAKAEAQRKRRKRPARSDESADPSLRSGSSDSSRSEP